MEVYNLGNYFITSYTRAGTDWGLPALVSSPGLLEIIYVILKFQRGLHRWKNTHLLCSLKKYLL
jgi:hypothetical protein